MTKRKRRRTRNSARLAKKRQDPERNVVDIFSSQVNYPTDVTVIGNTFEIPVHGIYLAAKSQSLCGILQQPSNENEKKWTIDTLVSKRVAILFLKHFYDGLHPVELDFSNLQISEYYSYLTLMKAHLGASDFTIMCQTVTSDQTHLRVYDDIIDKL